LSLSHSRQRSANLSTLAFILLYGVSYGLLLCIISIGLVVTMGLMRVVNLAHGAFAAIGGYLAMGLLVPLGVPFGLAIAVAVFAVAAFSIAVERLLYVHLYGASELDQVLLTVGINFLVVAGLTLAFGPNVLPTRLPPSLASSVDLGFRSFETYRLVVFAVGIVVIGGLWLGFERTNLGAQLRAAVDNRTMAQAIGINVPRLFSIAFAIGSALAALGGALGAPLLPLEPLYPFKYLILVLVIVALSGFGSIRATVFVAIFVGIVDTAARYFLPDTGGFAIYILLIVLMVLRPDGLLAARSST
jgi:branched-chain amino acid transport system permease protein